MEGVLRKDFPIYQTRLHVRSLAGFIVVDPRGGVS